MTNFTTPALEDLKAQRKCRCRWCKQHIRKMDALFAAAQAECPMCHGQKVVRHSNDDAETCPECRGTGVRKC